MRLHKRTRWRSGCRWWNNWPLRSVTTASNLYQAFIGLGVFLCLGSLYGLGSWFASQKPSSLLDVKTTQEGFLEVSKILGDPRTTTNHPPVAQVASDSILLTKDLYSSKWIRTLSDKKCPKTLLITVISAPNHVAEREAIRLGWGSTASKMPKVALLFLVGLQEDKVADLQEESDQHGDLVITDHLDSYNNLTLKTMAAFDWMLTFCPQTEYLLKTDDDMFIQVKRLMAMIRGLSMNKEKSGTQQEIIVGNVASGWVPVRNPKSKYFISEEQYSESSYPAFVTGPSYLVSKPAVTHLYHAALEHPFLHLEDVFLTGIIAEQVGVPRRLAVEFRNNAVRIPAKFLGCTLLRTISIHKVLPSEQEELAKMAKNPQCGKNTGLNKFQ